MIRLKKFQGTFMVHKHQGKRWTVRTLRDSDNQVYDWLTEMFGPEDLQHGPWARTQIQHGNVEPARYWVNDPHIIALMHLTWM